MSKCLRGTEWQKMKDNLDLMCFDHSYGRLKGYYRDKSTHKEYYHWLTIKDMRDLDEPFSIIEPMDLLFVDISPDNCGGIIVPRIPETLDELYDIQTRINNGTIILRGYVKHDYITKGVKWV